VHLDSKEILIPSDLTVPRKQYNRSKPEKKDFQKIIVKCVLHLLLVQTIDEVLNAGSKTPVYQQMPADILFSILDCLKNSYQFAHDFNADVELRTALFRMGFMKQMPNLLKQETTSVSTYVTMLIRMYSDQGRIQYRARIADLLIP
jgi:brefeldin A-inhibited guanine nucleotide-exchange protein